MDLEDEFESAFTAAPSPASSEQLPSPPLSVHDTPIEEDSVPPQRSRWPLAVILGIIALLLAVSFIWYVNPYPPLREALASFFRGKERPPAVAPKSSPAPTDSQASAIMDENGDDATADSAGFPPPSRIWDYYIQVSAWKELGTAQREANVLRKRGLAVQVEGEFIPTKKTTFYRVRIGPFATAYEARDARDSLASMLPQAAFLDSMRAVSDTPPPAPRGPQILQPALPPKRSAVREGIRIQAVPRNGLGVKVSSYRSSETAQAEAGKLLAKGYPAFVVRAQLADALWFRVFLGPFSSKAEAEKYARLIGATTGNDTYLVDFGATGR